MPRTAPFGTWESPVTLDRLVEDVVDLSFPMATPRHVYWIEGRPADKGRQVIVRQDLEGGAPQDVHPSGFNARTAVHEYGVLCAAVHHDAGSDDVVYFSNFADQRLYRVVPGQHPEPVTPEPASPGALRYACPVLTPDGRHLVVVRERHAQPDVPSAVVNDVVLVAADGSAAPQVLLEGRDFYSHLGLSADGRRLCWVTWDHPNMPWDGTELWEAELDPGTGELRAARLVAGGPSESVTQPRYGPDGTLYFVSDRSGWWNLYASTKGGPDRALAPMEAELALPDFLIGLSRYALLADGSVLAAWRRGGLDHLAVLVPGSDRFEDLDTGFTYVGQLCAAGDGTSAVAVAGSVTSAPGVVRIVLGADGSTEVQTLRQSRAGVVDPAYLSTPRPVEIPTGGGEVTHALYYPPTNADFEGPAGELPPLIVGVHGGPTSAAAPVLNYSVQFWTSRGFAVADVNYGGSTGYGRAYRERLRHKWGVVDLSDCVEAARHFAATGRADEARLLIHGGSAGGYTALCAAAFTDTFAAGASYFGVADATVFAEETHKFESRYMDSLFGPWPDTAALYRARSPAFHTEGLHTPLIIFQGLEDKVVPPNQAEIIVAALRDNGVPHAYVTYEGEQHGFRKAESIRRTAEAELYFCGRVLGFVPAGDLEPVEIVHEDRIRR